MRGPGVGVVISGGGPVQIPRGGPICGAGGGPILRAAGRGQSVAAIAHDGEVTQGPWRSTVLPPLTLGRSDTELLERPSFLACVREIRVRCAG